MVFFFLPNFILGLNCSHKKLTISAYAPKPTKKQTQTFEKMCLKFLTKKDFRKEEKIGLMKVLKKVNMSKCETKTFEIRPQIFLEPIRHRLRNKPIIED